MRRAIPVVILGAAALVGAACGRARPVASLSVEPASVNLPHPHVSPMRFRWNPTAELDGLEGTPRVFVHVLDGGRRLLRTFDHPLPEAWTPGRPQSYEIELYQSAIADPLAAGAYEITVGLYDGGGKKRWPLQVDGEEVGRREYRLATLVVPAAPLPAPTFEFRGVWLPVEPGSSKQVVSRRCLAGDGSIAVIAPPAAGTVRVAASVRSGDARRGVGSPLRAASSCSSATAEISGNELQWTGFDVAPAGGDSSCEIVFTPLPPERQTHLDQLCVEVLAWRSAGR